jgi:hypothetical protein
VLSVKLRQHDPEFDKVGGKNLRSPHDVSRGDGGASSTDGKVWELFAPSSEWNYVEALRGIHTNPSSQFAYQLAGVTGQASGVLSGVVSYY